jgi:hypothetical protein
MAGTATSTATALATTRGRTTSESDLGRARGGPPRNGQRPHRSRSQLMMSWIRRRPSVSLASARSCNLAVVDQDRAFPRWAAVHFRWPSKP